MRRALITLLCALLAGLTACSSTPKPQAAPPTERQSLDRSARLAFAQGQYAQAATLYEAALEQALAEDAPAAIIDTRFNLALCKTYLGQYDAALTQVAQAEAERSRRSLPDDPELQLLAGTIHYRAGESGRAKEILDGLLQHSDVTGATRSKAHFVAGLVAADDSVPGPLRAHIAAMPIDPGSTAQADRLELEGRLAGIEGDTDRALQLLDQVVSLRGTARDYRGMVRALASAGALAERDGRLQAAGNYLLRAGRSAAQRGEPEARDWLTRAQSLGTQTRDDTLAGEAATILKALDD
ncbi:MAG: hypothetical protein KDI67_01885 [Gammaproteobacteria bacterium]|nr:hypothetical protein [Gammaproteobacteria bacterium]